MRRFLKFSLMLVIAFMGIATITSCGSDDTPAPSLDKTKVIGSWKVTTCPENQALVGQIATIGDGIWSMPLLGSGTWTNTSGTTVVAKQGTTEVMNVNVTVNTTTTPNTMVWKGKVYWSDGQWHDVTITYTKQ